MIHFFFIKIGSYNNSHCFKRSSPTAITATPCVRKLFTGLIMYLPSQNKEHCIVLYCNTITQQIALYCTLNVYQPS